MCFYCIICTKFAAKVRKIFDIRKKNRIFLSSTCISLLSVICDSVAEVCSRFFVTLCEINHTFLSCLRSSGSPRISIRGVNCRELPAPLPLGAPMDAASLYLRCFCFTPFRFMLWYIEYLRCYREVRKTAERAKSRCRGHSAGSPLGSVLEK